MTTAAPLRVAFTGLAHSHPFTDAANVRGLGADVVAVHAADATQAADFAARFGATPVASVAELLACRPDVIVATPHPEDLAATLDAFAAAGATVPLFFNKVVAATESQLMRWEAVLARSAQPVGTASVLRFAPAVDRFAAALADEQMLAIRVHAQHDSAVFRSPARAWQDDPRCGGGTLVTVGVHAWELVDRIVPGAVLSVDTGWTATAPLTRTRSEDLGGIGGRLLCDGAAPIAVQALISGVPGPDRYALEVLTAQGVRTLELDVDDAVEALGFHALAQNLLREGREGRVPAPWPTGAAVVRNTVAAAAGARAGARGAS